MLLHVPSVLDPGDLARVRALTTGAAWVDGRITAGTQSEQAKNNLQIPADAPAAREAGEIARALVGMQYDATRLSMYFVSAMGSEGMKSLGEAYQGFTNPSDPSAPPK